MGLRSCPAREHIQVADHTSATEAAARHRMLHLLQQQRQARLACTGQVGSSSADAWTKVAQAERTNGSVQASWKGRS